MVKKKLSDYGTHTENPFMIELSKTPLRTKKIKMKGERLTDDFGEAVGTKDIYKLQEYDPTSYTKVFHENVKEFYQLKDSSFKVFFYMTKILKPNQLKVTFYREECSESIGVSETTIYRALAELVKNDFIARTTKDHLFFINPNLFFNGDRVRFIKEFRPKSRKNRQLKGQEELDFIEH